MISFLLFGTELPIDEAARRLAELTGQVLTARSSDYYGDYYGDFLSGSGRPHLRIIENALDSEGYLPEEDFPDPAVLLYVDEPTPQLESLLQATDWLELLQATEY